MSEKTVFISYRRDDTGKHFARLVNQSLTHKGYDVFLDVDCLEAGRWAKQLQTQVPKRSHFLFLLTKDSLVRCINSDDWVRKEFEMALATNRNIVVLKDEAVDLKETSDSCPECMKAVFDFEIVKIYHEYFGKIIEVLVDKHIPPHKAPKQSTAPTTSPAPSSPEHTSNENPLFPNPVDISRIDRYAPEELIGREEETKLLDEAWEKVKNGETPREHILAFVALGGEGKTSIAANWAAGLAHKDWPGCEGVFAWSFYSQGSKEQTAATSDVFLNEALEFFGDAEMANSPKSAHEKGKRLARLTGERRSLLILDGLEPLQYPPNSPMPGELRDQGIIALLKGLAANSKGLCVLTTRYEVKDITHFKQTTAPQNPLDRLSKAAGVDLLKKQGVKVGLKSEFEDAVEELGGHALSLTILGAYVRDALGGDIRKRDLVTLEEADEEEQRGHAFRAMATYAKWFEQTEDETSQRALALLRLLGLFDRPVDKACFEALLAEPAIPGLTDELAGLKKPARNTALKRLEDAKLITVNREDGSASLLSLDAHPLLREYFAKQLKETAPEAWKAGHQRIFEHLCETTNEGDTPTLEELQPLYQAVAHGCHAGLHVKARAEIYCDRILKGTNSNDFYSLKKLGAFGPDLGALACFFEEPWSQVSSAFSTADQSWLLSQAAFCLHGLSRLGEALEPMRAALEMAIKSENWKNAAIRASNLSELEQTIGKVVEAVEDAEQGVHYAEESEAKFQRMVNTSRHGAALHQAGMTVEAAAKFKKAEEIHSESYPELPMLYSLAGFQYCDLLLADVELTAWQVVLGNAGKITESDAVRECCQGVVHRAEKTLEVAKRNNQILSIGLDSLTLGRSQLFEALLVTDTTGGNPLRVPETDLEAATLLRKACQHADEAVDGLRRASAQHHIPSGLLTRAWARAVSGQLTGPESAQEDLDEAWEIAERGPMRLFMADIHLYRARLFFREKNYPWESPAADLAAAEKLINDCGYHRRDQELADAKEAIEAYLKNKGA